MISDLSTRYSNEILLKFRLEICPLAVFLLTPSQWARYFQKWEAKIAATTWNGHQYNHSKTAVWTNPDFPDSLVKALWPRPEQGFDSLAPDGFAGGCRRLRCS